MRKLLAAYWLLLTALLLVRNPFAWFHASEVASSALDFLEPWLHFLSFLVLGTFAYAARWNFPRWRLTAVLVAYAAATEIVQGFVGREPEWKDFWQDLLGLAIGAGFAWTIRRRSLSRRPDSSADSARAESWQTPRRRPFSS